MADERWSMENSSIDDRPSLIEHYSFLIDDLTPRSRSLAMLARLWWKEYRSFGPVWLILLGTAGLLQWFLISVNPSEDVKNGALTVTALAWAVLYAFATGAAAFAGERESKTLGFLDALPVGRWTLWLGKMSFALVTTYGLALVLAVLAAIGTEKRDPADRYSYADLVLIFGTLLFEAVAWSALWSALSRNPLMAAILGVLSVFGSVAILRVLPALDGRMASFDLVGKEAAIARWLTALGALALSSLIMAWRPRRPRPTLRVEPTPRKVAIRASSTPRSLNWQATREGWTTWMLVAFVMVLNWVAMVHSSGEWFFSGMMIPGGILLLSSLISGVSVFGLENASGGRRFLVHHGVGAGTVWSRRFLVWTLAIGSIVCGPFGLVFAISLGRYIPFGEATIQFLAIFGLALLNAYAVGLLCGMAITRRITAVLVGLILLVFLLPPQIGAASNGLVPEWCLLLVPAIFVAASRAWASDWLLEREGYRPWVRFAALLVVPFAGLFVAFVLYRAFGVPDVGTQFVAATLQPPVIAPEQDAALAYDRAIKLYEAQPGLFYADNSTRAPMVDDVIERGWDPNQDEVIRYWRMNVAAIDQIRLASKLTPGRLEDLSRVTVFSGWEGIIKNLGTLSQLLALDTRERLANNDAAGAWEDILAQLRMASQLATGPSTMGRMQLAMKVHQRAVALAFDWLAVTGQTPEILKRALADLKTVPAPPNAAATMRTESAIIERTLDRFDEDSAAILDMIHSYGFRSTIGSLWLQWVVAAPWERQRARRVSRLLVSLGLPNASLETYQRSPNPALDSLQQTELQRGWMMTRSLLANFDWLIAKLDRMSVERRALDQAIAIEAWKLGHDGKYPETLSVLVPDWLPSLPIDPFSGKSFGYVRSRGQEVRPLTQPDNQPDLFPHTTRVDQPLIYSVGPNRVDDFGRSFPAENRFTVFDLVFPIP